MATGMQITVYSDRHRGIWARFVEGSANGTLFHEQPFLDYHPAGRFQWHHLIFGNPGQPTAIIPGAIHVDPEGNRVYRSPSGATLGGVVVRPRLTVARTQEVIASLKLHASEEGFATIVMGTVPRIYWTLADDTLEFVLRDAGFRCAPQLMFYVPLSYVRAEHILKSIPAAKRWGFRKSQRQGLEVTHAETSAQIEAFYLMLRTNKVAHGGTPVHSFEELLQLKATFAERIRILCALKGGMTVAGVYCIRVTPRVWYTQYIADRPDCRGLESTRFVLFHLLQELVEEGADLLDLGPSVQLPINRLGGAVFKESAGGLGCERREWTLNLGRR
jgi:hypothetical protein